MNGNRRESRPVTIAPGDSLGRQGTVGFQVAVAVAAVTLLSSWCRVPRLESILLSEGGKFAIG